VDVPLLDTKLHRPRARAGAVPRARLSQLLDAGLAARLTLVCAPAGFGKTTAVAQWLGERPGVAWVSLDEHDDESSLWAYLCAALHRATGLTSAALPLLPSDGGLRLLLSELEALPDKEVVVVLDDYHAVAGNQVHEGIAFLLEHLPEHVHVLLATRVDPPLPLSRLRVRGELVEVRAADLRFTADEARSYLTDVMGLVLAPDAVRALADRTEGWAAALQLAGLSLQGRGDSADAVATFAGDDRFVVDYLVDEVLARQPEEVRDFLLQTSVLTRLTGPLCDAVTGRSTGAAQLVALERANLFVVPLDDRRQWYRYHHLFRDMLLTHLTDPAPLHLRASTWLEDSGDLPASVEHALAAKDEERAADLMERVFAEMARDRREPEFARWVAAVPEQVLGRRPVLAVWMVGALALVSRFDTVEARLDEVERRVQAVDGRWPDVPSEGLVVRDLDGYRTMPATVQMYRSALALSRGDLPTTVARARRALELSPEGDHQVRASSRALEGLAAWATGDLAAAEAAYTAATVDLRAAGYLADVLGLATTLADLRRAQGRLAEAEQAFRNALAMTCDAPGAPLRGTADMHVGLADLLLDRGDRAGAGDELARAEALGEHKGLPKNPYRLRLLRARLADDHDAALALVDEAERLYNRDYSPHVMPVPAVRARLHLRFGHVHAAQAWARDRSLTADDELSYVQEYEHVTLARILLACGENVAAGGLLQRLADAADTGGRYGTLVEILVLLALARGDSLERAVRLAEGEGMVSVFTDEGEQVQRLLRRLPTSPFVARLLRVERPVPRGLVEPLSEREMDVLRLLGSDLDGPDIARSLHVSLNTMRTHTRSIFRKLDVTSRRAAVTRATELALL
jgi:LuxR family maltose regulon positive regulatory protein